MKKRSNTYYVVLYAIYAALIFVGRLLDQLLTSAALPINFAVITLSITFSVAFIEPSLKNGLIAGLIFGLSSFIATFIFPGGSMIYGFANPLISVIPRIIVGVALYATFKFAYMFFKKFFGKGMTPSIVIACVVGALVNTVTVLFMIWVFKTLEGMDVVLVLFVTNSIPELIIPALIVPGIVYGVRRGLRIKDKYTLAPVSTDVVPLGINVVYETKEVDAEDIIDAQVVGSEIVHTETLKLDQGVEDKGE